MINNRIKLSILYAIGCAFILVIAGLISGVGIFILIIRAFVFGIVSFLFVFLAQLLLQNNILQDDEEGEDVRGNNLNVVVDDSYDVSDENPSVNGQNDKDELRKVADATDEVAYNRSRRVDDIFFDNSMDESNSNKVSDDFVDLSHEIEKSKKNVSRNPTKVGDALKKWVYEGQPKNM